MPDDPKPPNDTSPAHDAAAASSASSDSGPATGTPTDGASTDGAATDGAATDGAPTDGGPSDGPTSVGAPAAQQATVGRRERHYLVAKQDALLPFGLPALSLSALLDQLERDPAVTVERTLQPQSLDVFATATTPLHKIVVARMPEEKASQLQQHPQVLLEEDQLISPLPMPAPAPALGITDPSVFLPFGASSTWRLRVRGPDGTPVVGATVFLYASGVPAQGRTDSEGVIELSLLNESSASLRALYVNPQSQYWSLWLDQPALTTGVENLVVLTPLSETLPGFPEQQLFGWGQLAMRLDQVPTHLDGAGVKVAVVDSGAAAATHPDLADVHAGRDLTAVPPTDDGWLTDSIAHGSHCSGIIAGKDNGAGIRGFAPKAAVFEARIFPDGRVSTLLDALDYCIEQRIDIVNMSLGSGGTSELLLQKIAQAKQQGVACIVAAGNSGDHVQFPGSSPDVLTVAAVGRLGQFPSSSYHAQQVWAEGRVDGELFGAKFSCHGPEIDVCAPGVAVVSAVPDRGYAAWDGTSMAAPHVAGLAVLVLAHHPDFSRPPFNARGSARVDRLFELLKASARPVDVGDPTRTGHGLPDALRALGLESPPPQTRNADVDAALGELRTLMVHAGLLPAVVVQPATARPAPVPPQAVPVQSVPVQPAAAAPPAPASSAPPAAVSVDVRTSAERLNAALAQLTDEMRQAGLLSTP